MYMMKPIKPNTGLSFSINATFPSKDKIATNNPNGR